MLYKSPKKPQNDYSNERGIEKKGNLKDCMRFKYKIETSKVERDEANFDQFVSYINGIQSITTI